MRPSSLRVAPKLLDAVELERDRRNTRLTKPVERGTVVFARVQDDEIGLRRDDRFDVRPERGTEARDRLRRIGERVVLRATDESLPRADGEQDLGRRGIQRHDARGGLPIAMRVPKSSIARASAHAARSAARHATSVDAERRRQCENYDSKTQHGHLAMEENARNAETRDVARPCRHQSSPEDPVRSGANVSRLLAPGRAARLPDS